MDEYSLNCESVFTRSLDVFFLLDTSGSMNWGTEGSRRIDHVNSAMPIVFRALQEEAVEREINLCVRVIAFSDCAEWILGSMERGVPIADACDNWHDLTACGTTDTAAAIRLASSAMHVKYLGTSAYRPVTILVTDGCSNDHFEIRKAIEQMRNVLSGGNPDKKDKVLRFAIGVDAYSEDELVSFATMGLMEDEFGNLTPDQPMVFRIEDVNGLIRCMTKVSVGSVQVSCGDPFPEFSVELSTSDW